MDVIKSLNPSNGNILNNHDMTNLADLNNHVKQAVHAFKVTKKEDEEKRKEWLQRLRQSLSDKRGELAELISKENGKPFWEAQAEVTGSIAKIDITLEAFFDRCKVKTIEQEKKMLELSYKPVGVLAIIGPFNFPLHLPLGHMIPAILSGNSVVFKPSEYTIGVAKALMECLSEAKIPKDLVQLVVGDRDIGNALVTHSQIDGILFTGSYKTAQHISTAIAHQPEKLLAIECGGNNPLILESYDNIAQTVECIARAAFLTSGQRCTCTRRLIVLKKEKNKILIDHLIKYSKSLKVGCYDESPEPFYGPLISQKAVHNVRNTYESMIRKGGVSLIEPKIKKPGFFISLGIVNVTDCRLNIKDEECFGPLLQLIEVDNIEEAINIANETKYGLSASIITTKKEHFLKVKQNVKAGLINWNQPTNGSSSALPFGGVGCSGNFRPAGYWAIDSCVYPVASIQNKFLI